MENKYAKTARIFKALCDENRIRILEMLKGGERCACTLLDELNVTQPTLSHHMKILCDSGLVDCYRSGKWAHYILSEDGIDRAMKILSSLK